MPGLTFLFFAVDYYYYYYYYDVVVVRLHAEAERASAITSRRRAAVAAACSDRRSYGVNPCTRKIPSIAMGYSCRYRWGTGSLHK